MLPPSQPPLSKHTIHRQINYKRFWLYLLQWQVSTPQLAVIGILFASIGQWVATIVANLIGLLIFFWVDPFIFTSQSLTAQWED